MTVAVRYCVSMTTTHSDSDKILSFGEITNNCTCTVYDADSDEHFDAPDCYGECWEDTVHFFELCTEELRNANPSGHWQVENLRLWNGNVSGYFQATNVADIIRGMTVNSSWFMYYRVYADRIEYSLSHHDAPMGSASVLRPADRDDDGESYNESDWV